MSGVMKTFKRVEGWQMAKPAKRRLLYLRKFGGYARMGEGVSRDELIAEREASVARTKKRLRGNHEGIHGAEWFRKSFSMFGVSTEEW
jgi:hypothetical protein